MLFLSLVFELATAGHVLQDRWSLVLCTLYGQLKHPCVPSLRGLLADAFDLPAHIF